MSEMTELRALRKFYAGIEADSEFGSFDAFFDWAQGKYRPGHAIYKIHQNRPYSKENAYWYYGSKPLPDVESPICADCDKKLSVCSTCGCQEYRRKFVKSWNQNICRQTPKNREKWQYEHPDMGRENV